MVSIPDLLVLSRIPAIGPHRLRSLVSHFGDSSPALKASAREIAAIGGFSTPLASAVANFCRSPGMDDAREYSRNQLTRLNAIGASIISWWDPSYPEMLKTIYDPPAYLYVKGSFADADAFGIGIVGTRRPSPYGIEVAEEFALALAKLGITVVSGLARGVDTVAHTTTVRQGGRTIAVLGSGLDVIYPGENRLLSEKIVKQGAVVSEYEMGARPEATNFPKRNRIISGLTLGTLVIETDICGGAMITAGTALDQNREVFAVPGNIGAKRSRGCNALIREGKAKLVEGIGDVIVELSQKLPSSKLKTVVDIPRPLPELTLFEKRIYDELSLTPIAIDALAGMAKFSTSEALVHLLSLEFKGMVRQLPGKRFVRG